MTTIFGTELNISIDDTPTSLPVITCDICAMTEQLVLAREAIAELRARYPAETGSNAYASYMSPWKSHRLNAKLTPICELAIDMVKHAVKTTMNCDFDALGLGLFITDCWGLIYNESDYTKPHHHFPTDYVVVVYLEADDGCSPILFHGGLEVRPRPGLMVMFPGMLIHEVPANSGRRVSLVMNIVKYPTEPLPG